MLAELSCAWCGERVGLQAEDRRQRQRGIRDRIVPADFLVAMQGHEAELAHHHALLVANCFAQSQALMLGRDHDQPQRVFEGNRPSVTMAYEKLTPLMLGRIIALYEHRVFVEGAILGINSFDQFGVELGKALAMALQPLLEGAEAEIDSSTAQLVAFYRESLT